LQSPGSFGQYVRPKFVPAVHSASAEESNQRIRGHEIMCDKQPDVIEEVADPQSAIAQILR